MAELTLEQQRALAIARARLSLQEQAPEQSAARRDMTQAGALAQGLSSGAALNLNDEIAGLRAAGLAGLPSIVDRTVARVPAASAIAANIGGARMLAERALPRLFGTRATEAYAPARDVERARDKAAEEMFPATYMGSNIAGSVAVPSGMLGQGLKAATAVGAGTGLISGFGRGEGLEDRAQGAAIEGGIGAVAPAALTGLLRTAGSGMGRAALGATVGGAAGATQGNSIEERATNAAIGAGLGAIAPAALLMAGRPIVNTIQGTFAPGTVAERTVRQAIEADRARSGRLMLSPEDIEAARLSGQEIVVGDIGGTGTARLARAAANAAPDADATLRDVVTPRYEDQRKRFGEFVNDLFGGNLNMTAVRDTLEQAARRVNAPLYDAAYQAGENANLWNPAFERLAQSPSVQAAIRNAETRAADRAVEEGNIVIRNPFSFDDQGRMTWATTADGGQIRPNLQFWDQVQRNLREAAEDAKPGSTRQKDLEALRRRLNQELDTAVPEFGRARGMARQFFGAQDASEAGQLFFRQRQAMQLTDAQKAFRSMSEPERELFRRGFASELAHTLGTPSEGRDVVKMFSGIDRRKLELIFPPDELRQLEGFARREQIMNRLYTQVVGGSSTVRQARDIGIGVAGGGAAGAFAAGDPVTGLAMGAPLGALAVGLLSRGRSRISENVMREVGEILSSNDADRINKLLGGPNGPEIVSALRTLSTATNSMARPPRREPTVTIPPPGPPGPTGFARGGQVKESKMSPIVEAIIEEMGKRMAPEGARRAAAAAGYSRGGAVRKVASAIAERLLPETAEAPARGGLAAAREPAAAAARGVPEAVESVAPSRPTRSASAPSIIEDWQWRPNEDVMRDLNIREIPEHVQDFGQFMRDQAERAGGGDMGVRDLQKAFAITRASIQRRALPVDRVRDAGLPLPDVEGLIRPEGAMAEWLGTPMGQRYLDAAGRGVVDEEAIANAMQVMRPFGKHNDLGDALRYGALELPGREVEASAAISNLYRDPAAIDQWRDFGKSLRGIGPSKQGFVGSLLGAGADPTLDARQIILHTGRPTSESSRHIARRGGLGGDQAVDRLALRQKEMELSLPEELRPFYQHLAHHTVWDRAGNEITTHADVMRAMRNYGLVPGAIGLSAALGDDDNEMGKRMTPEGARRAAAAAGYSRGGAVRKVASAIAERLLPETAEAPARGGLAAAQSDRER